MSITFFIANKKRREMGNKIIKERTNDTTAARTNIHVYCIQQMKCHLPV
jgi:hypothetical protein